MPKRPLHTPMPRSGGRYFLREPATDKIIFNLIEERIIKRRARTYFSSIENWARQLGRNYYGLEGIALNEFADGLVKRIMKQHWKKVNEDV